MRAPAFLCFAVVACVIASLACSSQGEGEFCNMNNGNNDCQSGLECVAAAPGTPVGLTNRERCCPILPAQPTTAACSLSSITVIDASTDVADAQTGPGLEAGPPEAGPPEAGPPEAGPPEASVADASGDVVSADSAGDVVVLAPDAGREGGADGSP